MKTLDYLEEVLKNMPSNWLRLTTHRLDTYNEEMAKTEFLEQFEIMFNKHDAETATLSELPTAYDYIRLGHPLSCVLEWTVARLNGIKAADVISFSSKTAPILAILRTNHLKKKNTRILYEGNRPDFFNAEVVKSVYGYRFELINIVDLWAISEFDGSTILISQKHVFPKTEDHLNIDFLISVHAYFGSIVVVDGKDNEDYVSEVQHFRRRETIAMTPSDCLRMLKQLLDKPITDYKEINTAQNKASVLNSITSITEAPTEALVGSSGLSVQYAIMMGLIHDAQENHSGKAIKFIVPPNCYGGTNDQARRVAAVMEHVEIVDLLVDGDNDMVQSINAVLDEIAAEDAIPYIIAEIPTNPRVEVPDLLELKKALSVVRRTSSGETAIDPVFILDQTFCPNVHFLGAGETLSNIRSISYASGSKFPSGGKCTAGYCVGNDKVKSLMEKIELHLDICDNEATWQQYEILAQQLPSMKRRIQDAYEHAREFVNFIENTLPSAKINFVSEELASEGFTPSVFSLDLPTKGDTEEEREAYKRNLNHKLIRMMITEIPEESKHCVSYGQLKGCYWTIPATSTQGTTKEGDKDYIARVALSPDMNLEKHKAIFVEFIEQI